jgi:hypothetical protein
MTAPNAWIELQGGRHFDIARTSAWSLETGQHVVVDDGDTVRARRVDSVLGAGMVVFEDEDRVCQITGDVLVLTKELP